MISVEFDPPQRSDPPEVFSAKGDDTLGKLNPWSTQANALAEQVNTDAATAGTAATTATTQAGIATTAAGTATTQAGVATTQAGVATTKASEASASAATAVNAPGTRATSTTSHNISTGSKSYTVQTGKLFDAGQRLTIAQTSAPANVNYAYVSAYNSGTGVLDVVVDRADGTGTGITAWTISLSGAVGATGAAGSAAGGEASASPAAYATVTLTNASTVYQTITPQGWGCSVTLPNATTMPELGKAFVVNNASLQYPLAVYNTAGTLVAAVNPGEAVEVVLLDKAVSAGQWAGLNSACAATVDSKFYTQVITRNFMGVVQVSSTLFLLCTRDSVTDIAYTRVISLGSGQITVGGETPLSASTWGGGFPFHSAVLADGRVMLSGPSRAVALSISGVTPTVGAAVATSASFDAIAGLVPYSQGVFMIGSKSSATIGFVCRILSIGASGVAITPGTVQTSATAAAPQILDFQLDSDTLLTAITTFDAGTAYELRGFKAVRSGTNVTLTASGNAPSARAADEDLAAVAIKLGTSRFLASYRDTSGNRRNAVLDANTPAWGTSATNSQATHTSNVSAIKPITGGYAVAYHNGSTAGRLEAMSVSGSAITLGAAASFTLNSGSSTYLSASGTSALVQFANSGDSFSAKFAGTVTTAGPPLSFDANGASPLELNGSLYINRYSNNITKLQKVSVDASGFVVVEAQASAGNAQPTFAASGTVALASGFDGYYKPGGKFAPNLSQGFGLGLVAAETNSFLAYGSSSYGEVALIRSVA